LSTAPKANGEHAPPRATDEGVEHSGDRDCGTRWSQSCENLKKFDLRN
jgi:hypothetical protein